MTWNSSKTRACAGGLAALLLLPLAGCSSGNASSPDSFQMAFCGLYMNQDAVEEYGKALQAEVPALAAEGLEVSFTPLVMGAEEKDDDPEAATFSDPAMGAAGMMKFTAMIASGELDVVVSDMDNAARNARSESFLSLADVLSQEELAQYEDRLLSFEKVEMEGDTAVPTGEYTPACGIDVTGNEALKAIYGDQEIGVFIVVNSANPELAKQVLLALASQA